MEKTLSKKTLKSSTDPLKAFFSKKYPCWMMRQAGRYLPEYRLLREQEPDFIRFCLTPNLVTEATLQPFRRFNLDAGIIFSDILMIPYACGQKVSFQNGVGPVLEDLDFEAFRKQSIFDALRVLEPVYEGIRQTRALMHPEKPLFGFIGAPWTVLTYMVEGKTTKTFSKVKTALYGDHKNIVGLLDFLAELSAAHLIKQIEAGANILQIFDTWAGVLPDFGFDEAVINPTKKIINLVKQQYPHVPIMGFPKGIGTRYPRYVQETGVDGVSLDPSISFDYACAHINPHIILQGAIDPYVLVAGGKSLEKAVSESLSAFKDRTFIFNLFHGIVPETPISHVEDMLRFVQKFR